MAAGHAHDGGRVGRAEAGGARLDLQRQAVHLVLVQDECRVLQVVGHLGDVLDLVRHLLEVPHLSDHVGDHSHLGEVEQLVVGEVGRALLDEGQVGEVHAQVGDAGRVAAVQGLAEVAEAAVRGHDRLQLLNGLPRRL